TVGYIVKDTQSALLYSGDTHETEEIWARAQMIPNLKAAFIESSFPNEHLNLAKKTKHLTPALFAAEWNKLRDDHVPVYAYHLKPPYCEEIARELRGLSLP